MLGTARLLGQTLGTTLVALLFRMFAEGHRAQACLLLAIFLPLPQAW
jgi:DHA2 family multidrug resistance protein-like MFS transporter